MHNFETLIMINELVEIAYEETDSLLEAAEYVEDRIDISRDIVYAIWISINAHRHGKNGKYYERSLIGANTLLKRDSISTTTYKEIVDRKP